MTRNNLTAMDILQATSCKGMHMLETLGVAYQPKTALTTVRTFQNAWNGILDTVRSQPGTIVPSRNRGVLVVDGLYGQQTQMAVSNFIKISVPIRAADMPPWAARSEDAMMAMCPPAPPLQPIPAPVVAEDIVLLKQPPPIPVYQAPPPEVVPVPIPMGNQTFTAPAAPAPPPYVMPVAAVVPAPPQALPTLPPLIIVPTPTVVPIQVNLPAPPGLLPDSPVMFPSTMVLAPKAQGYGPMTAVGFGVVAVGGILTVWLLRRRRR